MIDSLDNMIDASAAGGERHDGTTSLDEYHIRITDDSVESEEEAETTLQPVVLTTAEPRKRGRPAGSTSTKAPAKKKAELAQEVERLQAELSTLRARSNDSAIDQLSKSIEMSSYLAFGWAAEIRGEHWGVTEDEAKDIGTSGAVAMAPYADQIAAKLPWFVFAGTLGKALFTRVKEDRRLVKLYGEKKE